MLEFKWIFNRIKIDIPFFLILESTKNSSFNLSNNYYPYYYDAKTNVYLLLKSIILIGIFSFIFKLYYNFK